MNNKYSPNPNNSNGKQPGYQAWLMGILLGLVIGSFLFVIGKLITTMWLNASDRGEFIINVALPKDATIQQTNLKKQEVEQYILSKPGVLIVFSSMVKINNQVAQQDKGYITEISVKLVDKSKRSFSTEKISQNIEKELQEKIEGATININNMYCEPVPVKRRYCLY